MSTAEYQVLGDVFLIAIVALFALALPGYALLRRRSPESDWNLGGNVGISVIQPLDLVVAGGYVLLFSAGWKSLPESTAKAAEEGMTVSGVVVGQVGMLILAGLVPAVLFWRGNLREFFGLRWPEWKKVFLDRTCLCFRDYGPGFLAIEFGLEGLDGGEVWSQSPGLGECLERE